MSIATVSAHTHQGTGVIWHSFLDTILSYSTSQYIFEFFTVKPTSIIIALFFTISSFTRPGIQAADIIMSDFNV
jgi:hypothetical protein